MPHYQQRGSSKSLTRAEEVLSVCLGSTIENAIHNGNIINLLRLFIHCDDVSGSHAHNVSITKQT